MADRPRAVSPLLMKKKSRLSSRISMMTSGGVCQTGTPGRLLLAKMNDMYPAAGCSQP